MFDYDKWQEIFNTIKKNKLRTALTMFGVFWGIFMLMLLLGSGNGLKNGVTKNFSTWATNSGFVWSQRTTMPYQGMQPGRYVRFTNEDKQAIQHRVEGLEYISPRNNLGGWQGGNNVVRKNKTGAFTIYGDYPQYQYVQKVDVYLGRHINRFDIENRRKIAVLGENVRKVLFEEDEDPIGDYVKVKGVYFKVVGVFKSLRSGEQGDRDTQTIYVPFTTFQQAFNYGNRIGWFAFTVKEGFESGQVEESIKNVLRERHKIHPEDKNALGSENLEKEFGQITGLFNGISLFNWIVGIGTLMAGVIGVSNIMLIIVKERTKEIGIRKSMGATPFSIVNLIMQESIFLTAIAGYIGLVIGMLLLEGVSMAIAQSGAEAEMFTNPEIDLGIALTSLAILIGCGALAGLIPARKAASIRPIEALRAE
ncbi:MAG: ABC transporter permease [Candidatus Cyclobacteriaceae bacterium M3_2C_046]